MYARGKKAWGECARSGRRMLLKDMVSDGYYPDLIVDPAWRDGPHPQEHLPGLKDATTLYRPAPENLPTPDGAVLTAEENELDEIELTWTAVDVNASQVSSYRVQRKVVDEAAGVEAEDVEWEVLTTLEIERDAFGAIEGPDLEYTDDDVDLTEGTYLYRIEMIPVQGPRSFSNVEEFPQE